jgi:hypothetical protein
VRVLQVLHTFRAGSLAHVSKPSISLWFLAGRHARLVVLGEDLTYELSAAAHPTMSKMACVTFSDLIIAASTIRRKNSRIFEPGAQRR